MTFGGCRFRDRFGLAGDHGLVNVGSALNDRAVCRNAGSGPDKHDVANAQLGEWNSLSVCALYPFSGVREQGGECVQRATSLGNGPHFQPVPEDHDRNQRRDFPPHVNLEEAECRRERCSKSDDDRQADQRHHARRVIGKLAPCPADEDQAAIHEDDRAEDSGDKRRARKGRRRVTKPVLNVG